MRVTNPAVYECSGNPKTLHAWRRLEDGGARCDYCGVTLTHADADDAFQSFHAFVAGVNQRTNQR